MSKAWLRDTKAWRCPNCGSERLEGNLGIAVLLLGIGKLKPTMATRKKVLRQPLSCNDCAWQGKVSDVAQLSKPRRKESNDEQG